MFGHSDNHDFVSRVKYVTPPLGQTEIMDFVQSNHNFSTFTTISKHGSMGSVNWCGGGKESDKRTQGDSEILPTMIVIENLHSTKSSF